MLKFDRKLANIMPFRPVGGGYNLDGCEVSYTVNLHPQIMFTWEYETVRGYNRWLEFDGDHD